MTFAIGDIFLYVVQQYFDGQGTKNSRIYHNNPDGSGIEFFDIRVAVRDSDLSHIDEFEIFSITLLDGILYGLARYHTSSFLQTYVGQDEDDQPIYTFSGIDRLTFYFFSLTDAGSDGYIELASQYFDYSDFSSGVDYNIFPTTYDGSGGPTRILTSPDGSMLVEGRVGAGNIFRFDASGPSGEYWDDTSSLHQLHFRNNNDPCTVYGVKSIAFNQGALGSYDLCTSTVGPVDFPFPDDLPGVPSRHYNVARDFMFNADCSVLLLLADVPEGE